MKTRNNIQKTGFGKVKKSAIGGFAILFGSVLISLTITAGNLKQQSLSNSNCCILTVYMPKMEASRMETGINSLEYHAQEFVDAEMAYEMENSMNNSAETNHAMIEAELSFQVEAYHASDFVETEMVAETENFVNINSEGAEAEISLQVEAYHAQDFADAELAAETENFMNSNDESIEAELINQVEPYHAEDFADAEMALEIESRMTMKENPIFSSVNQ